MEPGKIIPFFEHANLATSKGLDFLEHCLARKAIYHVLECETYPHYSDTGFYRFATALFPKKMVVTLNQEINRLKKPQQNVVRKRLNITNSPDVWRTPVEVVEFASALSDTVVNSLRR